MQVMTRRDKIKNINWCDDIGYEIYIKILFIDE